MRVPNKKIWVCSVVRRAKDENNRVIDRRQWCQGRGLCVLEIGRGSNRVEYYFKAERDMVMFSLKWSGKGDEPPVVRGWR